MVADIVSATLSPGVANEAVRLLSRIIEHMHIVADNGQAVLVAFAASTELHDDLCVWNASAELDEDDGTAEEDFRAHPRTLEHEIDEPPVPTVRLPSTLISPRMAGANVATRVAGGYDYARA